MEFLVFMIIVGVIWFAYSNTKEPSKPKYNVGEIEINDINYRLTYPPEHSETIHREFQIITESLNIVIASKNLETIKSRNEGIIDLVNSMASYVKDTNVTDNLLIDMQELLKLNFDNRIKEITNQALIKSKNAKTKRGKIGPIERVLTNLELFKDESDLYDFENIKDNLDFYMDYVEAADLYDKYKKYQFKNDTKKADNAKKDFNYFLLTAHPKLKDTDFDSPMEIEI